jgi:nitronate monooxygenase
LHALDPETAPVLYGQSARFVRAIRPAADIVVTVREEAERIVRTGPAALLD